MMTVKEILDKISDEHGGIAYEQDAWFADKLELYVIARDDSSFVGKRSRSDFKDQYEVTDELYSAVKFIRKRDADRFIKRLCSNPSSWKYIKLKHLLGIQYHVSSSSAAGPYIRKEYYDTHRSKPKSWMTRNPVRALEMYEKEIIKCKRQSEKLIRKFDKLLASRARDNYAKKMKRENEAELKKYFLIEKSFKKMVERCSEKLRTEG